MHGSEVLSRPVVVRHLLGPLSMFGLWLALVGLIATTTVLREDLTCLWLPTFLNHPPHPLPTPHPQPYTCHSWYYNGCEKVVQNPAVLSRNSYKTLAKRLVAFTQHIYVAWLQSSTRKPQWFQYSKLGFLKILNVRNRLVSYPKSWPGHIYSVMIQY